jgi:hypothetical protein
MTDQICRSWLQHGRQASQAAPQTAPLRAALAYVSAAIAVGRVPSRIGDLSERGRQLVDIVAPKRIDDPAIDAGFGLFLAASALVWLTLHAQHLPCDQVRKID